ncbi:MAG: hypothetical protein OEY86_07505 [Nitrospira sp.]|nr:hypothetical protein [Nitrospira sp.]
MILLKPISIRFSQDQHVWLRDEAKRQGHDRASLIVRQLVAKAMDKKKGQR